MDRGNFEIRDSKFGKGLFAVKDIEPGTMLCTATGRELNFEQTILLKEEESHSLQIDFDRYILCDPPFLYSNHSCNPNCAINGRLELVALKKIKAGKNYCGIIRRQCLNVTGP